MKKKDGKGTGIAKKPVQIRTDASKHAILKEAVERVHQGYAAHKDNMDRAEEDAHFIFGEQYDADDLAEKAEDNRLALTFNKLPQFINKVVGQQRSSVQTINISPSGSSVGLLEPMIFTGKGDKKKLSEVLTDLTRDIEYQSNAVAEYKTAFKHAVEGGFGWLRVLTKYQDDGFDLDIQIKSIRDRWSVIIDPDAVESDKSDMNWAVISEKITEAEFNRRYPGKSTDALPGTDQAASTYWEDDKTITISEYFRREPITKEISLLSTKEVIDSKDLEDDAVKKKMDEKGITVVKSRKVQSHKVIWCKITQGDILEEEVEFPTTTIPIIPMLGREMDLRGKRETKGLIHDAKDAQIALNAMRSSALERIDSSPITPWIATDKSIEGYEEQWEHANSIKFSTLVYRKGEEKPTRDHGATMPVAELQTAGVLDEDMKASIGIFNASLGNKGQEKSGIAIKAQQSEADVGTYEFMDNYQNAIRRVGLLVTELIPRIYDTERIIQTRSADGSIDTVKINEVGTDNESGEEILLNSLNSGKHTVVVSSGASYETKRDENAQQILDLMKANPKVSEAGVDLLVKNLDFSDSDVLAERLLKTVPMHLLSKEKQEEIKKDMPEPQPSAEQIAAQAESEKLKIETDLKKFELESKVKLETIKLEIEQTKLEAAKIAAGQKIEEGKIAGNEREEARKDQLAKDIAAGLKKPGQTTEGGENE